MEHPNASAVRQFLTAWFLGDEEAWHPLAADGAQIHLRGGAGVDGPPVAVEIDDVFADDNFAVAIVKVAHNRPDGRVALTYACAQRIDATGRICEVWNVSDNRAAERLLFPPEESQAQA